MSKSSSAIVGIIVVVIIAVGGYAIFHKSPKTVVTSTSTTQSKAATAKAVKNQVLITETSPTLGAYLAEPNGDALYVYGGDSSGTSTVTGSLLASWPAYQDKGAPTGLPVNVGTIKRTDNGELQYTFKGLPLYTFVNDSPGQVTGNNVSNFKLATPYTNPPAQPSTSSSSTGSSTNNSNPY